MDNNKPQKNKTPRKEIIYILLILLAGLIFRLILLGDKGFYEDEGYILDIAFSDFNQVIPRLIARELHPPVFFFLVHTWYKLGQILHFLPLSIETYFRLLSVIFSMLNIYFTYLLGRKIFSGPVGLLSALFMAFSTFHIGYSKEVKMYSLILFLMLGAFYYFFKILEEERWTDVIASALFTGLACLTHYFGFFIYPVIGGFLIIEYILFSINKKQKIDIPAGNVGESGFGEDSKKQPGAETGFSFISEKLRNNLNSIFTDREKGKKLLIQLTVALIISALLFFTWFSIFINQVAKSEKANLIRPAPVFSYSVEVFGSILAGFTFFNNNIIGFSKLFWISIIPIVIIIFTLALFRNPATRFTGLYLFFPYFASMLVSTVTIYRLFERKFFFVIAPPFWFLISLFVLFLYYKPGKVFRGAAYIFTAGILLFNLHTFYNHTFDSRYLTRPPYKKALMTVKGNVRRNEFVIIHPPMLTPTVSIYLGKNVVLVPLFSLDMKVLDENIDEYGGFWLVSSSGYNIKEDMDKIEKLKVKYPYEVTFTNTGFYSSSKIDIYHFDLEKQRKEKGKPKK